MMAVLSLRESRVIYTRAISYSFCLRHSLTRHSTNLREYGKVYSDNRIN